MNSKFITNHFNKTIKTLRNTSKFSSKILKICKILKYTIQNQKKIYVYGNGGSFADSSHFVGELTSTFKKKRKPLPFFLLGANIASLTAWANDYNFTEYLSREIDAYCQKNDVLIIFSTSGGDLKKRQSLNLIKAAKNAILKKTIVIAFLGKNGGELKKIANYSIIIKTNSTAIAQENHKVIMHTICDFFEK